MTKPGSSARGAASPSRIRGTAGLAKGAALLALAAAAASCATSPMAPPPSPVPDASPPPGAGVVTRDGVTPPFMASRRITRVGVLLPFASRPQESLSLYNAVELALFDHGDPNMLLIPRDSGGDEAAAAQAGEALLRDGADIIVGPVLRDGVVGVSRVVRRENIPVIGFSSDRLVGGDGVYLLSFQLEDEIRRLVSYAASQGIRTIALLAPANDYGRRVEQTLRGEARRLGVTISASELYVRGDAEAGAAARRIAQSMAGNPAQGILIAESGSPLRAIAAALVQEGVNQRQTRFLGTSAWSSADVQREPTLAGAWYVSSDPNTRAEFEQRYQRVFGQEPHRLSSLSYDAILLAAFLSAERGGAGFTRSAIERSEGFLGSDGVFRFRNDGSIERGLAIMEVRAGGAVPIDAAPRRFTTPAS